MRGPGVAFTDASATAAAATSADRRVSGTVTFVSQIAKGQSATSHPAKSAPRLPIPQASAARIVRYAARAPRIPCRNCTRR